MGQEREEEEELMNLTGTRSLQPGEDGAPHLEGLDERPKQSADALPPAEQLHQAHDPKQTEERDGNASAVLRVLRRKESGVRGREG